MVILKLADEINFYDWARPMSVISKSQIFHAFGERISITAIQNIAGEWMIKGKWCFIAPDDGKGEVWDIWICNSDNLCKGLGQRKVKNILHTLNGTVKTPFRELTGEAWGKVRDKGLILQNLHLLGIRKKRQVSPQQAVRSAEILKTARNKHRELEFEV